MQIVVARYNENLDWLNLTNIKYIIYNKGEENINHPYVKLPNIGREAHTFLHHIVNNYDELDDITYFLQGNPILHQSNLLDRLIKYEEPTSLTSSYNDTFPSDFAKSFDYEEIVNGLKVRYGDARFFGNKQPKVIKPKLKQLWSLVFSEPQPDTWWYGYGAMYAVPKQFILKRNLKEWQYLLHCLKIKILSPWCLELLWYYLYKSNYNVITKE